MSKIVDRTFDFLELFGRERRPLLLSEMAQLLNIPISSCHDVIRAMQARGYLYEIAPRAGYYPTRRLNDLAKEIADNDPILLRAELLLRSLRDTLDETVLLAKVSGLNATYLLLFESTHPLRIRYSVGDNISSLYATSAGKALLSTLDERALTAFLKSAKLVPRTNKTIQSTAALRKDVELGRKRGWHLNQEESLVGVTTISATFTLNGLHYVATVAGPSSRIDPKLETITGLLTDVCRRLGMERAFAEISALPDAR